MTVPIRRRIRSLATLAVSLYLVSGLWGRGPGGVAAAEDDDVRLSLEAATMSATSPSAGELAEYRALDGQTPAGCAVTIDGITAGFDVRLLAKMPWIRHLTLNLLEPVKLDALRRLPDLETVRIVNVSIGPDSDDYLDLDLSPLVDLPRLHTLELSGVNVRDESAIAKLGGRLERLSLDHVARVSVATLASLAGLRTLSLTDCPDVRSLAPLSRHATLTELSLRFSEDMPFEMTSVVALGSLRSLRRLEWYGCPLTDLRALAPLAGLESLELVPADELSSLQGLEGLTSLKRLVIWDSEVRDFRALVACRGLTHLDLNGNAGLTDLSVVAGMVQLEDLSVADTGVTDVTALRALPRLAHLDLNGCNVTDLRALHGHAALRTLDVPHGGDELDPVLNAFEAATPQCTVCR